MKKPTLHKVLVVSLFPLVFSFFLSACGSSSDSSSGRASDETVSVTLRFRLPETKKVSLKTISDPSAVASMQITVRGQGMTTMNDQFSISPGETVSRTLNVLPGLARIFAVRVFDIGGIALFEGESGPIDILPASGPTITIVLQALFPSFFSELPRFSSNYVLIDVPGTSPFSGLSESDNYSAGVGVAAVTGEKSISENYTLR